MSDAIATQDGELSIADLPRQQYAESSQLANVAISASFFPQLKMFATNAKAVARRLIQSGNWGIELRDQVIDLGQEVNVKPYSWRFKAIRYGDDNNATLQFFNPKSQGWAQICAEAGGEDSGCQYGVEFLCWLPIRQQFVAVFFGGKSSRPEAPKLEALLKENASATLKGELVEKKHTWWAPIITKCSTPHELPSRDDVLKAVTQFVGEKDSDAVPTPQAPAGTQTNRDR